MIKARIRWCTCRVENILTLGKLLSLWFCFLPPFYFVFDISTSSRTYKIISSYELARPVMGTIFLVNLSVSMVRKASLMLLSRYRFKRSSKFMQGSSSLLSSAYVGVGFSRALMRVEGSL